MNVECFAKGRRFSKAIPRGRGRPPLITGRLKQTLGRIDDGSNRSKLKVIVDRVQISDSKTGADQHLPAGNAGDMRVPTQFRRCSQRLGPRSGEGDGTAESTGGIPPKWLKATSPLNSGPIHGRQ